jgi:hypothetical protein
MRIHATGLTSSLLAIRLVGNPPGCNRVVVLLLVYSSGDVACIWVVM